MNQRGCVWVQTSNESTFRTSPITVMLAGVQSSSLFSVSWHWLLVLNENVLEQDRAETGVGAHSEACVAL